MFNNPLLFVDPNGKENIIYLLTTGDIDKKKAKEIAAKANAMLRKVGVDKVEVRVYDAKKNGKFDEKKLDKTDNWAVVGTDRKAVAKLAKEISSDKNYEEDVDDWVDETGYPEVSNNRPMGKGIVVDYDDSMTGKDKSEEAALFTIHGAAHSSSIIKDAVRTDGRTGHLDDGVMQRGPEIEADYRRDGLEKGVLNKNPDPKYILGNDVYRKAMMDRYSSPNAKDNYGKKS